VYQVTSRQRSCVHPFIRRTQSVLTQTGSLRACFREIPGYQARARTIYRVDVYCVHAMAVSTTSLGVLAVYEYARYCGLPFPDSRRIIQSMLPMRNSSERMVIGKSPEDGRHEAMGMEI
jgi:hypothetical protein